MSITRTPLFFGQGLFGWLHAPVTGQRDLAALICQPLGHEYVNAHRSMRHLADRLARAGIPALRFDYHGTGDSAGTDEDPGRVAAWRASVAEAMQTLRELSGCPRTALIGFRFGATLAAQFPADVHVLWAPVMRGKSYARELKALHLTSGNTGGPDIEPGGFVFTEETQRDLAALTVDVPNAIVLWPDPHASAGYAEMLAPPHSTRVPFETLDEIVRQLTVASSPLPNTTRPRQPATGNRQQLDGITETLLPGKVFGILTEPAGGAKPAPAILLPNAGSVHHIGPSRLYVLLARTLAKQGFRVIRFDLPGLGDSVVEDASRENHPYEPPATPVLAELMPALGQESYVVAGLCSGAHAAFHAARELQDAPVVESILINPLTFYYEPGMSLDTGPAVNQYSEWQRYLQLVRSREGWKKVLHGDVGVGNVLQTVMARFGRTRRTRRNADLAQDLRRIAESGRRLTFLFSRLDSGYDLLMLSAGPAVRQLQKEGRLQLWRIDGANHTFDAKAAREVLLDRLTTHLTERYLSTG
ncbi:MAG TPA: alpha/beta fold hydrolase [Thermoanaerobaculia bacterium]|jgi:pimeloyl-ACP methyl ester carboxylesterase